MYIQVVHVSAPGHSIIMHSFYLKNDPYYCVAFPYAPPKAFHITCRTRYIEKLFLGGGAIVCSMFTCSDTASIPSMQGLGTNDRVLVRVMVSRCEVDMVQIKKIFYQKYHKTLGSFIKVHVQCTHVQCIYIRDGMHVTLAYSSPRYST